MSTTFLGLYCAGLHASGCRPAMNADRPPTLRRATSTPAPLPVVDRQALAARAGEEWAHALAADLRSQGRSVVGGWPGTMKQATGRVVAAVSATGGAGGDLGLDELRDLARTAYASARTAWLAVSSRDEEP